MVIGGICSFSPADFSFSISQVTFLFKLLDVVEHSNETTSFHQSHDHSQVNLRKSLEPVWCSGGPTTAFMLLL